MRSVLSWDVLVCGRQTDKLLNLQGSFLEKSGYT